jgi:hypothetical protein
MADKTHGELIRDLLGLGAALDANLESLRGEVGRLGGKLARVAEEVNRLVTKVALVEQQMEDRQKSAEETARRRWTIVGPVLGALLGSILTALLAYLLRR